MCQLQCLKGSVCETYLSLIASNDLKAKRHFNPTGHSWVLPGPASVVRPVWMSVARSTKQRHCLS